MNPDHLKLLFGPGGSLSAALAEGEKVVCQVDGECMEPALGHQSSVELERPKFFIPGDVVAFHCESQGRLLVHRFLGYVRRRGVWKIMTMPDRGLQPDALVDLSEVLGRVIAQDNRRYRVSPIKRLGSIYRYIRWCFAFIFRRLIR